MGTSGQDGGVGRYTSPLRTTKRRTTTNLETKNNQNYQKIEPYGSQTTKELKKKLSSREVGVVETGIRAGGVVEGGDWWSGWSHILHVDKLGVHNWGARQTTQPRIPVWGNKASKPLT